VEIPSAPWQKNSKYQMGHHWQDFSNMSFSFSQSHAHRGKKHHLFDICHTPKRTQLHLFVIVYTPREYSFICLLLPILPVEYSSIYLPIDVADYILISPIPLLENVRRNRIFKTFWFTLKLMFCVAKAFVLHLLVQLSLLQYN
jgi:hypothetical protein